MSRRWYQRRTLTVGVPLLAGLWLYLTYIYTDANPLRSQIYEPLFGEAITIEGAALACTPLASFPTKTYDALNASGSLTRIPGPLRERAAELYRESAALQREVLDLTKQIQDAISPQLRRL